MPVRRRSPVNELCAGTPWKALRHARPSPAAGPSWENAYVLRTTIFLLLAALTVAAVLLGLRLAEQTTQQTAQLDAEDAAESIVDGTVHESRRDGGRWEVDVVRPDGSIVQVNLADDLELRSLDEEVGPAGTFAPDELRGRRRTGAVAAAFDETGAGEVVSVERDRNGDLDVRVRTRTDGLVKVELDRRFRVLEVQREDRSDE